MENSCMEIVPHPQWLEALFAYRSEVSAIFKDVLGVHDINHIAISQISPSSQILTFSSTPAMEFNLFNSNLWQFDKSYQPEWFTRCTQATWQSLYEPERYDELYYLKQVRHHYPSGSTLATKLEDVFFIYSFASHRAEAPMQGLFVNHAEELYKIGEYCTQRLSQLIRLR